jgi:hypothetical protein
MTEMLTQVEHYREFFKDSVYKPANALQQMGQSCPFGFYQPDKKYRETSWRT